LLLISLAPVVILMLIEHLPLLVDPRGTARQGSIINAYGTRKTLLLLVDLCGTAQQGFIIK
jgi:hypothetical protein